MDQNYNNNYQPNQQQGYGQPQPGYVPPQQGYVPPQPQPGYYVQPSGKSKVTAGLLAIFLGALGIHKFYLGYNTEAIIMLLLFLFTGIGLAVIPLIALIEGIIYLTKTDQDFDATYVYGHKGWF